MLTIIIVVVLSLILGIVFAVLSQEEGCLWMAMLILTVVTIGFIFSWLVAGFGGGIIPTHYQPTSTTPLVAANDGSNLSGSFFLGSGSFDDRQVYSYRYQIHDGGIIWTTVTNGPNVRVYEEDRTDAVLIVQSQVFDNPAFSRWFLVPEDVIYEFHVPAGSVRAGFVFDGQ